ncbi:MAG: aspartate kinase [Flavobacteriales bacterium]
MKVFKFGGASVKDAAGVRNVAEVVKRYGLDDLVIVVSAMGKTTNALEAVTWAWLDGRPTDEALNVLESAHVLVLRDVAPEDSHAAEKLRETFQGLRGILKGTPTKNIDRHYDQVVAFGELWSSIIVHAHLKAAGVASALLDARTIVRTDARNRSAGVDWEASAEHAQRMLANNSQRPLRFVTQGFIGSAPDGSSTTLGREGSDFSAAIFAYLLDAESVTIWKDVAGMYNADPNVFPGTKLLERISYREAIELSYFGASVIHPRTLQPLQRKNIPLFVRSFLDTTSVGSTISAATDRDTLIPSFIVKPQQLLVSITPRDLSFIVEENLSGIFKLFADRNVRIDLMQNSAVAFSVAVDDTPRSRELIEVLRNDYQVLYNEACQLITVRHYDEKTVEDLLAGKEVLIEQRSRTTARFVVK